MKMFNKSLMVFLCLVLILGLVSSASISGYVVPTSVNVGQTITATGLYVDENNEGVLCSFYLREADTGALLDRATDQYTTATGRFTMTPFPITEPLFKRDSNYNILSECSTATSDANFNVSQRETISHIGGQEFDYITLPENLDTFFIWGTMILVIIAFAGLVVFLIKYGRGN